MHVVVVPGVLPPLEQSRELFSIGGSILRDGGRQRWLARENSDDSEESRPHWCAPGYDVTPLYIENPCVP